MRLFISFDMEGVAGIADWAQCLPRGQAYEEGARCCPANGVACGESGVNALVALGHGVSRSR